MVCLVKVTDFPKTEYLARQVCWLEIEYVCERERERVCLCVCKCLYGVSGCFGICDSCFKQEYSLVRHAQMNHAMQNHPELDDA